MPRVFRLLVVLALIVTRSQADDLRPPTDPSPPLTAYARMTSDGKVTLRLLDVVRPPQSTPAATNAATPASGDTVGWRVVTLNLNDPSLKVRDTAGRLVAADKLRVALGKETPVLVSTGFVDRFHLLTTREGTLVFTVPARILPSAGSVSSATEPMPIEVTVGSDVESLLLKLTNAERDKAQVPALSMSPLLLKAARQHSENMAKQHKLEHQLDGKNASDRLNDLSYTWRACGENIALGPRTPADAIRSWMESPGHRANLLSADFTQIGVALQADANGETYWTMVLAAPR